MKARALSAKQFQAARLLTAGASGAGAARELGIRAETLSRWQSNPSFAAELSRLADAASEGDARTRATALVHPALDLLAEAMRAGPPELAVQAAAAVLVFFATCNPGGADATAETARDSVETAAIEPPAPEPAER